jgi:hypothetical protein
VRIGQDHYLGESRPGARVFFCSGKQFPVRGGRRGRPRAFHAEKRERSAALLFANDMFLGETLAEAASNSSNGDKQIRIETVLNCNHSDL